MQFIVGILLITGLQNTASAQFSDSVTHYAKLSALGNINRSNSTTAYLFTNDARFSIKNRRTTLNAGANWLYGELDQKLTNNDFTTTVDFNVYPDSSKFYFWALANFTTSYSLKIDRQFQTGLGIGYNFVNTPTSWLNVSEGILYDAAHLAISDPEKNDYKIFRNSLRLSYRFAINDRITFNGVNFLLNSFSDRDDYVLRTLNGVNLKLNSWISISSAVTYNLFKLTDSENFLFTYGIVLEKFF